MIMTKLWDRPAHKRPALTWSGKVPGCLVSSCLNVHDAQDISLNVPDRYTAKQIAAIRAMNQEQLAHTLQAEAREANSTA